MKLLKEYFIPRIIQYFVVIFIGITLVFLIPRLGPINPVQSQLTRMQSRANLDPATVEHLRNVLADMYGLEGGIGEQYVNFWKRLFSGRFGPSFTWFPTPVMELIGRALPWTVGLFTTSALIAWIIGVIFGGVAAYFPERRWAQGIQAFSMMIRPFPIYVLALLLMIAFAYLLPIFPIGGAFEVGEKVTFNLSNILTLLYHATLPALTIILLRIGRWFIQTRNVASNVVSEGYVTYAEAAGLSKTKITFQYVIRNALLPQVTGLALSLGTTLGGTLVVEIVFSYPGVGRLLYQAILGGDYNVIMGVTTLTVVAIATAVLILDFLYPLVDPRITRG